MNKKSPREFSSITDWIKQYVGTKEITQLLPPSFEVTSNTHESFDYKIVNSNDVEVNVVWEGRSETIDANSELSMSYAWATDQQSYNKGYYFSAEGYLDSEVMYLTVVRPEKYYNITIRDVYGGTITCDKKSAVEGDTYTVSVSVSEGYKFTDLQINGESIFVEGQMEYVVTMGTEDVVITGAFEWEIYGTLVAPTLEISLNDDTQLIYSIKNSNSVDVIYSTGTVTEVVSALGALELTHIWDTEETQFLIGGYFSADHYINSAEISEIVDKPQPTPVTGNYVKFESDTAFTFTFDLTNANSTIEYSLDNSTWDSYASQTQINVQRAIYLRGTGGTHICTNSTTVSPFTLTNATNVKVSGNLNALLDYENPPTKLTYAYCFKYLFSKYYIVDVSELILPAMTLAEGCYQCMFCFCSSLTSAPALPATTLADYCYESMFRGCSSLTSAPTLPATTLADYCYYAMFSGCSSLTSAPALPATTLASGCYKSMFHSCKSLTSAPELPATTLAGNCYNKMFYGCTSLKLSETQTDEYKTPYRIPTTGTGTTTSTALYNMFTSTGGTFTGTPTINTTYYGAWE